MGVSTLQGAPTYDFAKISQKLLEIDIEKIWIREGGHTSKILLCSVDLPLGSTKIQPITITFLPTAREGNVFTGICNSVHNRPYGYSVTAHPCYSAVGTHPTGMLSCSSIHLWIGRVASLAPLSVQLFYFQAVFGKNYVSTPWGWHPLLLGKPGSATGVPFSIFILRSSLSVNLCIKIYFTLFQEIDYFSLFYLDVYSTFLRNLN